MTQREGLMSASVVTMTLTPAPCAHCFLRVPLQA